MLFPLVYCKTWKEGITVQIQDGCFTLHGMLPLQCMNFFLFNIIWHVAYQIEAHEELNSSTNIELTLAQSNERK